MKDKLGGRLWINWEVHRRSSTLAEHFGCTYVEIVRSGPLRYLACTFRTLLLLLRTRPRVLFVQNPSQILATIAVIWRLVFGCYLVVDRHSTFLLGREGDRSLRLNLMRALSRFTLRFADLTIVTNQHLASLVISAGGNPVVLPDKLPAMPKSVGALHSDISRRIVVVSSFAEDEPIANVVQACTSLSPDAVRVFITGRVSKAPKDVVGSAPPSVVFTDYLSDLDYTELILSADLVVVLTTSDYTMLCGCYEAVSAGRALVTSNKDVLKEYFVGAHFVDNSVRQLEEAFRMPDSQLDALKGSIVRLKSELTDSWSSQAVKIEAILTRGGESA